MKKIFALFVLLFACMLVLIGCSQSLSGSSVKKGLEDAKYKVTEYTPEAYEADQKGNFKATKFKGLKSIIVAYKDVSEEKTEGLIVFVFDSTSNAGQIEKDDESLGMLLDFGKKYGKETDSSTFGTHNNVVWAGASDAKAAAGIKNN